MKANKDLEFWLNFINENEEKETNDEVITFYDFKQIFEYYLENLKGELDIMIYSLKFPYQVKDIELKIKEDDDGKTCIKLCYHTEENGYKIDSYDIDELGVYYTGYTLTKQQQVTFYQENYDFFKKIISVYYLDNLFYAHNFTFYREYRDNDNFGTKITFSNRQETHFTIWRKVSADTYGDDSTIFSNKYVDRPDIDELYDNVLKRNVVSILNIDDELKYLIELAKIDGILESKEKVKKINYV